MDKMCDGHPWCITNTTNIQYDFGLPFMRSTCAGHLQCTNTYCDYLYCNGVVGNWTEWIGSTPIPFDVGDVAPEMFWRGPSCSKPPNKRLICHRV
jgi:hypothetical protein